MASYTYSYLDDSARSVVVRSDGVQFTQDTNSPFYQAWQAWLAAGNTTTVGTGLALAAAKVAAHKIVDQRAVDARLEWTQDVDGDQDLSKWLRFRQALDWQRDGSPNPTNYPLLTAEIPWTGANLAAVATAVLAELDDLNVGLADVESARREVMAAVDACTTIAQVRVLLEGLTFSTRSRRRVGSAVMHLVAPNVTLDHPQTMQPGPAYFALVALTVALNVGRILTPDAAQILFVSPPLAGGTGWSNFPYAGDARLIYVANAGNNSNSGLDDTHPKQTIAAARALMRDGKPDWILLKKGDTFNEPLGDNWVLSGRSASEPMGWGTYGTGARPIVNSGSVTCWWANNANVSHLVFVGISLRALSYDGTSGTPTGIAIFQHGANFYLEDMDVRGFATNIVCQAIGGRLTNFSIRRSIVADAYCADPLTHCQGLFISETDGVLLEENLLDQNGWRTSGPGAVPTIYRHNLYSINNTGVVARNNLATRTDAMQFRSGGTVVGNVCSRLVAGLTFGKTDPLYPGGITVSCTDNVVLESRRLDAGHPSSFGIIATNVVSGDFARNVVANAIVQAGDDVRAYWFSAEANHGGAPILFNATVHNSVAHEAGRMLLEGQPAQYSDFVYRDSIHQTSAAAQLLEVSSSGTMNPSLFLTSGLRLWLGNHAQSAWCTVQGATTSISAFLALLGDSTSTAGQVALVDGTRTLGSYATHLGVSLGGEADMHDAFLRECRLQSKDNWRDDFTAINARAWLTPGYVAA